MLSIVILSVIVLSVNNGECSYAESRHAECASTLDRMGKIVAKNKGIIFHTKSD
jgi:hypothetical protein